MCSTQQGRRKVVADAVAETWQTALHVQQLLSTGRYRGTALANRLPLLLVDKSCCIPALCDGAATVRVPLASLTHLLASGADIGYVNASQQRLHCVQRCHGRQEVWVPVQQNLPLRSCTFSLSVETTRRALDTRVLRAHGCTP